MFPHRNAPELATRASSWMWMESSGKPSGGTPVTAPDSMAPTDAVDAQGRFHEAHLSPCDGGTVLQSARCPGSFQAAVPGISVWYRQRWAVHRRYRQQATESRPQQAAAEQQAASICNT